MTAVLLAGASACVIAGPLHWGLRAGAQASTLTADLDEGIVAPFAGAVVDLAPDHIIGVRTGLGWDRRGARLGLGHPADNGRYCDRIRYEFDDLTFPVLLRLSPGFQGELRPTFLGGVEVRDRVNECAVCLKGFTDNAAPPETPRWDMSLVLGFAIECRFSRSTVGLEFRRTLDLVKSLPEEMWWESQSYTLGLIYWPNWARPVQSSAAVAARN